MSQNVTQKTVLNLLSAAMFQKSVSAEESIDWSAVLGECRAQAVTSLSFAALPKEQVPEDVFDQWKYLFNLDVASNSRISYAHTVLHELLTEHRIQYVILKGCISARYYDNPVLRTMGDIDFYINPSDKKRVDSLLKSHGFELQDNDHEFETVYTKDGRTYVMYSKIMDTRYVENFYETLLTCEERIRGEDMGNYYLVVEDNRDLNYDKLFVKGEVHTEVDESFTSHNTKLLDVEGTVQ